MAIDIDSFLEDFEKEEFAKDKQEKEELKKKSSSKKNEKKVDLEFNINNKFKNLQENISQEDFEFLVKAYSEIKKFEENLPNKFFEIKKESSNTISNIGSKYTQTFLQGIKNNMQTHGSFITKNIIKIEQYLKESQVQKAVNLFNEITRSYKLFPKEFIFQKIEIGKKIRELEIQINEQFESHWKSEIKKIKKELSNLISELKHNLVPGNIEKIEELLSKINETIEQSPNIFYNELLQERIQISKIMIIAENFLKQQYEIEFKEKEQLFEQLFEQFHKYQLKKDIQSALTTYDELTLLFEKLPDAFIEKKIELYNKINTLFDNLNNLLLSNNIETFMSTYNNSKIIAQAREYINHAQKSKNYDISNLITINENLKSIPTKLSPEKQELEKQIQKLIEQKNPILSKNTINKTIKENQQEKSQMPTKQEIEQTLSNQQNKKLKINNEKKKQSKTNNKPQLPKQIIHLTPTQISKLTKINKSMVEEINNNYHKIIKSTDKTEKNKLKKKIEFYLNLLPLKIEEKNQIKQTLKLVE